MTVRLPLAFVIRKATVVFELFWRLLFAMTQSCRVTCGYFMVVGGATRLPPPCSDDSAAAGPPLLIRQALSVCLVRSWPPYLEVHISIPTRSPIRHVGRRLVASSLARV